MDSRIRNIDAGSAVRALPDLFMPRRCTVCRQPLLLHERILCDACRSDLPLARLSRRARNPMADRFNARIEEHTERFEPYAYAAALFVYRYESRYDNITQVLKYRRDFRTGRHFGAMLGASLAASPLFRDVDTVVPVPLHWTRLLRRGYNQAEVIAREVARALPSAHIRADLLIRSRRTLSQAHLDTEAKRENVNGAFSVRKKAAVKMASGALPRHILIIDDVFTTGATTGECHKALRAVLPSDVRISAASLGFVEDY